MKPSGKFNWLIHVWIVVIALLGGCTTDPSPALSPEEEQKSFLLAPGMKIELVASEPLVQEPVVIQFDRKGRLWVVEMRSFMQDIDGTNEEAPIGRVSVLLDDDSDGQMDRSIVFADSLVLPRSIAFVKEGVLIAEDEPLWLYQDMDGDLIADKRTLVDANYGKKGIVEHAPNGLLRGFDGWLYNAKSDHRYKEIDGKWVKAKTEFRGQWGISQDNVGRLYYNYNWSQLHADLVPPDYLDRNPHHKPTTGIDVGLTVNRSVFPIRPNLAANRGYLPGTLDEMGKIKEFTSACSPFVYRGGLFPEEYSGNVFVCEPVGNLVKRNLVFEDTFNLTAEYAYDSTEFIASTDERFRPVALTSGPDGALYIADMYHGIIEHGPYMTEYLKEVTLERKLTSPIHCGRIWRVVPENHRHKPLIDLEALDTPSLVALFDNQNGWYRDQAQQLIIERKDERAINTLIQKAGDQSSHYTARIHSLWALDQLGHKGPEIYYKALEDKNDHVRALAIRLLEGLVGSGATSHEMYADRLLKLVGDSPIVDLQIALSSAALESDDLRYVLQKIANRHFNKPLIRDAVLSSLTNEEYVFMTTLMQQNTWDDAEPDKAIMLEMLASAVTRKAKANELTQMIGYINASNGTMDWKQKAILEGMYLSAMDDDLVAVSVDKEPSLFLRRNLFDESYHSKFQTIDRMFEWPGKAIRNPVKDTSRVEIDPTQFAYGRKQYLNICAGCHGNDGKGMNRFGPPLRNSEWVLGSDKRLALLLIHGMQGPVMVAGKEYGAPDILPEMPSFSVFDDSKLAAIMTYIRNEWGHRAGPVKGSTVAGYRVRGQGKLTPWTADELMEISD